MVGRQRVHVLALALPVLARVKRDGYVAVVEELVHSSNVPHVVMVGPALHAIAVAQHRAIRPGYLRDRTRRLRRRLPHATHRASRPQKAQASKQKSSKHARTQKLKSSQV